MSLTDDLFESASTIEQQERLKDPQRYAANLFSHLNEYGKYKGKSFLTEKEKEIIRSMLDQLVETTKRNDALKDNFQVVYAVFLSTCLAFIKETKDLK